MMVSKQVMYKHIDTSSYAFNALLSGSIYGGHHQTKSRDCWSPQLERPFFALGLVKHFLDNNPDAGVVYFETESALTKDMIEERGIDTKRIVMMPVTTIQEFRTEGIRILDKYIEQKEEERKPLMFVLDSLGMLSTTKEIEDTADGKETRDMTGAQLTKAFRVLTLKLVKQKFL